MLVLNGGNSPISRLINWHVVLLNSIPNYSQRNVTIGEFPIGYM